MKLKLDSLSSTARQLLLLQFRFEMSLGWRCVVLDFFFGSSEDVIRFYFVQDVAKELGVTIFNSEMSVSGNFRFK